MNYVYKVVYIRPKSRFFSSSMSEEWNYELEYKIGEITTEKPNTIGIFVFNNLENATYYLRRIAYSSNFTILKCIPFNKKEIPAYIGFVNITLFYQKRSEGTPIIPNGTLLFEKVKPVEIVLDMGDIYNVCL